MVISLNKGRCKTVHTFQEGVGMKIRRGEQEKKVINC